MDQNKLLIRINQLIDKGKLTLSTTREGGFGGKIVDRDQYFGFRSAGLSFISNMLGKEHAYYQEFEKSLYNTDVQMIKSGISVLLSIKEEIEQGWLISIKQLITAEVFSDFLDMSNYFLDEGYKDPAAIMIGSVLEEHLRQLCANHSVDVTVLKGTDIVPKKADLLNADLVKAGAYGILEQKSVTAWLDLRNKAAHGKYSEYTIEQVKIMYLGVLDFVSRIS